MLIDGKFDGHDAVLRGLGVDPRTLYHASDAFDVRDALFDFSTEVNGTTRSTCSAETQFDKLERLFANPMGGNYCAFICGYPTDARAKMLGAELLKRCWDEGRASPDPVARRRRPLWYTLHNSYVNYEALREKNPSVLFISNVTDDSTPQKMERLRDLLEMFSGIPRVVMFGSAIDPVTLAATRLRYSITHPFMLKGKTVAVSILDGL